MAKKTFVEWINWFEKKSGEKFRIPPRFNLEFQPDKGFLLWKKMGDSLVIDQVTTDDWEFWGHFIVNKGTEIGCKRVHTVVRRDPVSYARLTGAKIIINDIEVEGKKAAILEWDTLPEVLAKYIAMKESQTSMPV